MHEVIANVWMSPLNRSIACRGPNHDLRPRLGGWTKRIANAQDSLHQANSEILPPRWSDYPIHNFSGDRAQRYKTQFYADFRESLSQPIATPRPRRLNGGGGSRERTALPANSLLSGINTGIFQGILREIPLHYPSISLNPGDLPRLLID